MIDPYNITNYNRTLEELEEFLIFCLIVAGKTAVPTARKLQRFLEDKPLPMHSIRVLSHSGKLLEDIKKHRLGNYTKTEHALKELAFARVRLDKVNRDKLVEVKGIGMKTASFYILHSRPDQNIAVLDTHVLKWLQMRMTKKHMKCKIPKSTPSDPGEYRFLEMLVLRELEELGYSPAEGDQQVWNTKGKLS